MHRAELCIGRSCAEGGAVPRAEPCEGGAVHRVMPRAMIGYVAGIGAELGGAIVGAELGPRDLQKDNRHFAGGGRLRPFLGVRHLYTYSVFNNTKRPQNNTIICYCCCAVLTYISVVLVFVGVCHLRRNADIGDR